MRLDVLLSGAQVKAVHGPTDRDVAFVTQDSRRCSSDCVYVAVKGTQVDGHRFIPAAIAAGATTVVCESAPTNMQSSATYVITEDAADSLGVLAANFFGNPSRTLTVVGVTGTNGKTTTATLLHRVATACGHRAGLLSTIHNIIGDEPVPTTHTTPDPVTLQQTLKAMVDAGCSHAFMEVSSHAVVQRRVAGLRFSGGVFTNLTHDHLDYHRTIDAYFQAKKQFIDSLDARAFALTNLDDERGEAITRDTSAATHSYAIDTEATFRARITQDALDGVHIDVGGSSIRSHLVGRFNAYNLTAAFGASRLLGFEANEIVPALESVPPIDGRFDWVRGSDSRVGVVDFAHTPDGLSNFIRAARGVFPGQRLVLVLGCGGDRDREKRPVMGGIAASGADEVIFTSDNPRSEDPGAIIDAMIDGVPGEMRSKVAVIKDRAEAILAACERARENGVVLVAGKGHERTQDIGTQKKPFSDRQVLEDALLGTAAQTRGMPRNDATIQQA